MDFKVLAMVFIFSFLSFAVGYIVRKTVAEKKIISAETYAKNLVENAQKDAEASKKEKVLEAKEEIHKMRQEHDKEYKDRRNELQKFERRLVQKEEQLDKKIGQVDEKDKKLSDTEQKLKERESKIDEIREQQLRKLEEVSNLTVDEARKQVLDAAERDLKYELSAKIKAYIQTVRRALIARYYDQVVVLTKADANRWKWFCRNVVVIPNPLSIATNKISPCESKQIIAVGRLNREKGFDFLIDAWKIVYRQHPDWILRIYGEGDMRSLLQSQINTCGLQQAVFLMGNTSHIIDKYLNSSIFILSSRSEGFPLACLEALACGLPIVSFKLTGVQDLIKNEENGYLTKKIGDTQSMSNAICKLIESDILRKRFGQNSLEIAKKYDVKVIMGLWEELFNKQVKCPST